MKHLKKYNKFVILENFTKPDSDNVLEDCVSFFRDKYRNLNIDDSEYYSSNERAFSPEVEEFFKNFYLDFNRMLEILSGADSLEDFDVYGDDPQEPDLNPYFSYNYETGNYSMNVVGSRDRQGKYCSFELYNGRVRDEYDVWRNLSKCSLILDQKNEIGRFAGQEVRVEADLLMQYKESPEHYRAWRPGSRLPDSKRYYGGITKTHTKKIESSGVEFEYSIGKIIEKSNGQILFHLDLPKFKEALERFFKEISIIK